ncbi:MAG: DUF732 domain-containing protein [Azonexus sp.]
MDHTMKRILALCVLLIAGLLVVRDLTAAAGDAKDIVRWNNAVDLYEGRHGSLSQDERVGYLDNAYQACSFLDTNPSLPDLWSAMTDSGISSDAAATTIEAAITYLCTEHKPLLDT